MGYPIEKKSFGFFVLLAYQILWVIGAKGQSVQRRGSSNIKLIARNIKMSPTLSNIFQSKGNEIV